MLKYNKESYGGIAVFERFKRNREYKEYKNGAKLLPIDKSEGEQNLIHFLATGGSDAILLESNGHFALVDCAEDSDNPRGFKELEFRGYENEVLDYLKKAAGDSDGKVHLDFVLGTHAHSDHIGGFDTVISDENIFIDKAYLKRYEEDIINSYEKEKWDNREVYEQMVDALKARNVPIISDIEQKQFKLGDMSITLFNTEYDRVHFDIGENDNSIGVLVEVFGIKTFLSADIDNKTGDEDALAPEIGKVEILKVGHHSYSGSSTNNFLKTLNPEVCIVTNDFVRTDKKTLNRIKSICNSVILVTGDENGIVAAFKPDSTVLYYNKIM